MADLNATVDTTQNPDPATDPAKGTPDPATKPDTRESSTGNPNPDNKAVVEDPRIKGMLADLQKERARAQRAEKERDARLTELELERKRVRGLAGVEDPDPDADLDAQVKAKIDKLYPHLAGLSREDIEAIKADLADREVRPWREYGNYVVSAVGQEVAKELGGELSQRQLRALRPFIAGELEANPELVERYEKGDKTLVAELAKFWLEDWYKPASRKVTAAEVARGRRVPSGRDRSVTTQGEPKVDVHNDKAVEDLLVKGFRERGGQFSRE